MYKEDKVPPLHHISIHERKNLSTLGACGGWISHHAIGEFEPKFVPQTGTIFKGLKGGTTNVSGVDLPYYHGSSGSAF